MKSKRSSLKTKTQVVLIGATVIVLLSIAAYLFFFDNERDSQYLWFEDIKRPISLSNNEQEVLVRYIYASLQQAGEFSSDLPASLAEDTLPRIIFLTASDGAGPPRVVMSIGRGIVDVIEQAIFKLTADPVKGQKFKWLKLDIVQETYAVTIKQNKLSKYERSLYGLAFDHESGMAFLPEELVANTLVNSEQKIVANNMLRYANKGLQVPRKSKGFRFKTRSAFYDGKDTVQLYRGHRLFNEFSPEDLLESAELAGKYLIKAVGPEGKFNYIYLPKTGEVAQEYNILRHAGTIYSMLELYEVTKDRELLHAAQRALNYLMGSGELYKLNGQDMLCIVENDHVKLGGNALAAIAFSRYIDITQDQSYLPHLISLGKWIQSVQAENGRFIVHKQNFTTGKVSDFVSGYYPGEAILALVRIYEHTHQESWLDTAERASQYLINIRDKGLATSELSHDHWLLYGLNELYRYRPKPLYMTHVTRIAKAIMQSQNQKPLYRDWFGSYYRPPRSAPSATRSEGLLAAYELIRDYGNPDEAERILEAVRLGVAFQLQLQFRPESSMYLENPQRVIGGFKKSHTDYEIRIDYVQHNMSSFLSLYHVINNYPKSSSAKTSLELSKECH